MGSDVVGCGIVGFGVGVGVGRGVGAIAGDEVVGREEACVMTGEDG